MVSERRKNDRVPFYHSLEVRRVDTTDRGVADACDLSIAGMSFRTHMPLAVGDEVRIHIANVVEHASIAARVRHVVEVAGCYMVGVEHAPLA